MAVKRWHFPDALGSSMPFILGRFRSRIVNVRPQLSCSLERFQGHHKASPAMLAG